MTVNELKTIANEVRKDIIIETHASGSGHPGGSLSAADIFTCLYFYVMNLDKDNYQDDRRDRFVLSKGHTAPGLYSVLAQKGIIDRATLPSIRRIGSKLQGHPNMRDTAGVEMSTGSLGQGVSAAVGMALSGKMRHMDYRVYALLGDGEIQEGQVWEAAMFAGAKALDNLTLIIDNNNLQIDGTLEEVVSPYPIGAKFAAFNFHVIEVADGNDMEQLIAAFDQAKALTGKPVAIVCRTVKGKGVSFMENAVGWHGKAPNDAECQQALAELGGKE